MRLLRPGFVIFSLTAVAAPATLAAQVVHGRLTTTAGAAPVASAVVTLLDSAGGAPARTLSDSAGRYRLVVPRPGAYRVRAQRIGFRPVTSAMVRVTSDDAELPIAMTAVAVTLDAMRVAERSVCGNVGDSTGATFALWEQTRAALLAAQVTSRMRGINATVVMYERTLDPRTRRVRDQTARVSSGFVTEPWRSAPVSTLRREGYIGQDAAGWVVYRVPGLDVLVSDAFIQDHCFRVVQPRDRSRIGIAFEPTRDRRELPEVRGTIWLERATHALRSVTFGYTNVSPEQEGEAGGELQFAQLRDGGWAVSRWHVDMPAMEQHTVNGRPQLRIAEIKVAGGDLSLAARGSDTLWRRAPVRVAGEVTDSATRAPVAGAIVSLDGTAASDTTDERGRFTFPDVLPGAYTLAVRTRALDSLGVRHEVGVVLADQGDALQVRMPGRARFLAAAPPATRLAVLAATVQDSASQPVQNAVVTVASVGRSGTTGEDGRVVLADVPPGRHQVSVRRVGFAPADTTLAFAARDTVRHRFVLRRAQTLDTVSVRAASVIPSFDEHRALKRGHFITREELARMSSRPMSSVLADLPAARLVPMQGSGGSILATRRRSTAAYRRIDDVDTRRVMQQGFCPATVYLNNAAAYSGAPGEPPFNVNSLSPDDIEAVEYYASASEVPPRYAGRNVECGVLVIDTRRGAR